MRAKIAVLLAAVPISLACVALTALAPGAAAKQPGSARASVVGGKLAAPGQFPWMAFVLDFHGEESLSACTGTVLAPRIVLTAGHCTLDEGSGALNDPAGYRVVTGSVDWTDSNGRQVSEVTQLIPYPRFASGQSRDGFGDAALLVLATPTTVPSIPIATPSNSGLLRIGTRARIAGWGLTWYEQAGLTESLMWAKTVVESSHCEGLWGRICAVDYPKFSSGSCFGDSGGPLFAATRKRTWVEIGIVEGGFDKCTTRRPQLYTRTDLLSKWIKGRIQEIEAQP
jgi:secreted trypsin-like serine protease